MSNDIHALSGAYAVDALDDIERAQFERHLADCDACRAEVDSLREAAGTLAETVATEPPPELRSRVLRDVAAVRPLAPPTTPTTPTSPMAGRSTPRSARRNRWWAGWAAAAVLVALAVGGGIWQPWQHDHSQVAVTAAAQVINAPDAQKVGQRLADGSHVTVYRSPALNRVAVTAAGLPPLPTGKAYELWLQDDQGAMHPAGLLPRTQSASLLLAGAGADAAGVGLTVEPAAGSSQPTTKPLILLSLRS